MSDDEGKVWIVYNGEIYNFPVLRQELERDGVVFRSHTDTEVIIYLYKRRGLDCLDHLRGMFAFALWDNEKKRLFLARDRAGQKPLLYSLSNERLTFASEMRALLCDPSIEREIDLEALDLYLSYQFVPAPYTMFRAVKKLPPAHYLVWEDGQCSLHKYWELNYCSKVMWSEEEAKEALREKIKEAVSLRLISDVPLGALLSGGVDSGIVVALMSELMDQPVKTFSIGFEEEQFNELPYARRVAEIYGTDHRECVFRPDLLGVLPVLVAHYGEPFADKSAVPSYYVAQMARQEVTVALNGDGGDELFVGYDRFKLNRVATYLARLPKSARMLLRQVLNNASQVVMNESFWGKVRRKLEYDFLFPESRVLSYQSFFTDAFKRRLYLNGMDEHIRRRIEERVKRLLELAHRNAKGLIERMLWIHVHTYLPDDLLVKMDIAGMANSLETRSPFLDHELIEFVAKLPTGYKIHDGTTKYLLKKLGEEYLPRDLLYRPKRGFAFPVGNWLRSNLNGTVEELLVSCPMGLPEFFNMDFVGCLWNEHKEYRYDHSYRLWSLLNFELWYRMFVEQYDVVV